MADIYEKSIVYESGRMSDDKILSLCITVAVTWREGQLRLFRLADIVNGELKPYQPDYAPRHFGTNTQYIYPNPNETTDDGEIGLWHWYSPDGVRQHSYRDKNSRWFEVVRLKNVTDVESLRHALIEGINIDKVGSFLIDFADCDNGRLCVYCDFSNFRFANNKYGLKDDVYSLKTYIISSDTIYPIQIPGMPDYSVSFYRYTELPEPYDSFLVRTPYETIRKVIKARINKCTDGFSKPEKSTIRAFVNGIANENVINSIIAECKCSIEEAQQYLDEFIIQCEEHFTADDFDESVMLRLVSGDSDIGSKYKEAIRNDWERQNSALLEKAEKEYRLALEKRDKIHSEIEELEALAKTTSGRLEIIQKDYCDKIKLADGVADKIRSRIVLATEDLSTFLAQYSLFLPVAKETDNSSKLLSYVRGTIIDTEPDELESSEVLECLKENLEAVGVKERSKCVALGAYLLAAYYVRVPLILAGFGAELIADALSATLFNRTSDKVYADKGFEYVADDDGGVVSVFDGLGIMNKVTATLGKRFICFIVQTSEELLIEPRSLYNYALPVFAEYYISCEQDTDGLYGTVFNGQLDISSHERKMPLPDGMLPLLACSRLNKLSGAAIELYSDLSEYDAYLFAVLPVMLSLSKREELIEIIQSSGFSDKEKKMLFELLGETQ